jgi:crotonobetainyl-CoA:carnitine CoA-transferase CaiB-like acyl-CoA transferase
MSGLLDGVVVLDLTRALAGPHAGMMLADLGARVIKVESPGGDESRAWGPPFVEADGQRESTYFMSANRNKESITLDLKTAEGKRTLERLVRHADVLLENFRRGVLERLGFSAEQLHELNPRLVILSITGFGHDGPDADRPGYDQIAQGEAGLMSLTGPGPDEPTRIGVPIGDLLAGMYGAFGVVAALYERGRTGQGRVLRTSLLAAIVGVHAFQGTRYTVAGEVPQPQGNHHPSIAPYGMFRCANGNLQVAVGSDVQWTRFVDVLGLDGDDPRFLNNPQRVTNRADLIEVIERALTKEPIDHWLAHLADAEVPAGKVRTLDEVYECEQTRSQGLVIEVEHPTLGTLRLPGPPLRFDGWVKPVHSAPPLLGEHNASVAAWLDTMDTDAVTVDGDRLSA